MDIRIYEKELNANPFFLPLPEVQTHKKPSKLNQRKLRKLARQNPHSKYAKR